MSRICKTLSQTGPSSILISMPVAATVAVIIVVLLSVLALVPVAVVIVGAVVVSL